MSRSGASIALLAGAVALGALVWTVGARRETRPIELSEVGATTPEPEPEVVLVAPFTSEPVVGSDTREPSLIGDARSPSEPAPLVLIFHVLEDRSMDPIAGALVRTFEDSAVGSWTTDEHGECVVTLPAGAHGFRLHVEKEGFVHIAVHEWSSDWPGTYLFLARATTLAGRLLAADSGEALPGARIALSHDYCEAAAAVADSGGRYELAGVPLRTETYVGLEAPGFPPQARQFQLRSDESRIEQDFRMQRGWPLRARVLDWDSGLGIAEAELNEFVADADGVVGGLFLPQSAGVAHVNVVAKGYCQLWGELERADLERELELRLPRSAVVEGMVRDARGQPVTGAQMIVRPDWREQARRRREGPPLERSPLDDLPDGWRLQAEEVSGLGHGETDDQGRFRIATIFPWSACLLLESNADGYARFTRPIERAPGPGESVWMDLVLEPNDEPPEAMVQCKVQLNGSFLHTARGRVRWRAGTREGEVGIHNGDAYLMVRPGEVECQAEIDGLPPDLDGLGFQLTVTGSERKPHLIQLSLPALPITGRVTYADGSAATGASVNASCPLRGAGQDYWERLHLTAKVGETGSFALSVPDWDRSYELEASMHHDDVRVSGVRAGAEDVDLVLRVQAPLLFRVLDAPSGQPIPSHDFELGWRIAGHGEFALWGGRSMGTPDADGWLEEWLPAGRLDLRAQTRISDHRALVLESVQISAGGDVPRIDFALARGIPLELMLADGLEPPPASVGVLLVEEEVWNDVHLDAERISWEGGALGSAIVRRFVSFGEKRTVELRGLGPGRYHFKVIPPQIVLEPEFVTLQEGVPRTIEVRWRPAR